MKLNIKCILFNFIFFRKILEDYESKMRIQGRFVEANLAKEKKKEIISLKNNEIIKLAKNRQKQEEKDLEKKQIATLNNFNEKMDQQFLSMQQDFSKAKEELALSQTQQISQLKNSFNAQTKFMNLKPSKKLIELNQKLDYYVKKKDYVNAHYTKNEIIKQSKIEKQQFEEKRQKELDIKVKNAKSRQKTYNEVVDMKLKTVYNNYKVKRAAGFEKIINKCRKERNVLKDLHNHESKCFKTLENNAKHKGNFTGREISNMPSLTEC